MTLTATLSLPSFSSFSQCQTRAHVVLVNNPKNLMFFQSQSPFTLLASRRTRDFPQEGDGIADDRRNWSRQITPEFVFDEEEDDEDGETEEDRSLDLLVRFVENVFRKISKRAKKAVRSVLPISISTKLVGFSVNGVLILAFLWISKAFLEVVCTLGTIVFTSILLIRGLWAAVTYIQEYRNHKINFPDEDPRAWTGAQPVS